MLCLVKNGVEIFGTGFEKMSQKVGLEIGVLDRGSRLQVQNLKF